MTIGIGFLYPNAVTLSADRQITSSAGYKFEENKIFSTSGDGLHVIFCYAGDPDKANAIFHRIVFELKDMIAKSKSRYASERIKLALKKIFKDAQAKGLRTLSGIAVDHYPPLLYRTKDSVVVQGISEYIGVGDSSVLRYLATFSIPDQLSRENAEVLASYFVSVANRFVDGCSGGPDTATLETGGKISETHGPLTPYQEEVFRKMEQELGEHIWKTIFRTGRGL